MIDGSAQQDDTYLETLGSAIRNARKAAGLGRDQFARDIGLGRSYMGDVETGKQNLTLGNLMTILEGLGMPPKRFFEAVTLRPEAQPERPARRRLPVPVIDASASYGQAFGMLVRYERQRVGWSQDDFALLVGCSRPYLNGLELGRKNPTFAVIMRIAEALSLQPVEFFRRLELHPIPRVMAVSEPPSKKGPHKAHTASPLPRSKARLRAQS